MRRDPAFAHRASDDSAMARGPAGGIGLTIPEPAGHRIDTHRPPWAAPRLRGGPVYPLPCVERVWWSRGSRTLQVGRHAVASGRPRVGMYTSRSQLSPAQFAADTSSQSISKMTFRRRLRRCVQTWSVRQMSSRRSAEHPDRPQHRCWPCRKRQLVAAPPRHHRSTCRSSISRRCGT